MKPEYNIMYDDKQGNRIHGRRLKEQRKIELETGRIVSHTWATNNLDYVGKRKSIHDQREKFEYYTTPNGFRIKRFLGDKS